MLHIIFPHFIFLSRVSHLKAISAQKVFSITQHHKMYCKSAKHFPLINDVREILS